MSDEALLQRLKEARDAPAVQKARLAILRSVRPDTIVFAFEGIDDKAIYYHWVRRVRPELVYEPFVCHNKDQLLKLVDSLERDQTGLSRGVYFFVDRDFDDLRGRALSEPVFLTDAYSVENYLVNENVFGELLKIEFHCHEQPALRGEVIEVFRRRYGEFLQETRDLNFRLFLARRCGIVQAEDLPRRINQIATVSLTGVVRSAAAIEELVRLQREPSADDITRLRPDFDALDGRLHFRGKFALLFFKRLLELMAADRNSATPTFFNGVVGDGYRAAGGFDLDSLAPKSDVPEPLQSFLTRVVH